MIDWGNAIVLLAIIWAFGRRLLVRPTYVPVSMDAMIILGAIATLCLTHFGYHAYSMAAHDSLEAGTPISTWVGEALGLFTIAQNGTMQVHANPVHAEIVAETNWWSHAIILLGFLNYLPFSKHNNHTTAVTSSTG